MPGIEYTYEEDLPDDYRHAADLLDEAIEAFGPLLTIRPWPYVIVQLALHRPSSEPFFLVALPGGEYVALSPVTERAHRYLTRSVPSARPLSNNDASAWANRERWTPIIGQCLYRLPNGAYAAYDPRLALPDDAPTYQRTPPQPEGD